MALALVVIACRAAKPAWASDRLTYKSSTLTIALAAGMISRTLVAVGKRASSFLLTAAASNASFVPVTVSCIATACVVVAIFTENTSDDTRCGSDVAGALKILSSRACFRLHALTWPWAR